MFFIIRTVNDTWLVACDVQGYRQAIKYCDTLEEAVRWINYLNGGSGGKFTDVSLKL